MSNSTAEPTVDVIVIGGGLAGLATAIAASRGPSRTLLLEANTLGGRAKSVDRDGMLLNDGAHALYLAGEASKVLAEIGIDLPGAAPLQPAYFRRGDELSTAPTGAGSMLTTNLLTAREKLAFPKAMLSVMKSDLSGQDATSLSQWLDAHIRSSTIRSMVESLIRVSTYCNDPEHLPASVALGQLRLAATSGVRYLDGGWRSLVTALAERALAQSVEIREHQSVTAVERDDRGFVVTTAGGAMRARVVVFAAGGPGVAVRLAGIDESAFATAGDPVIASVLDLIVDRLPARPIAFGLDQPLYLSAHNPPAKLGRSDRVLLTAMWYHEPGESASPDEMRARLRRHFDVANAAEATVIDERYLHRMVVAHGRPTVGSWGLAGRPGIGAANLRGVYVAGDWVGPAGMLADAALASGWAAGTAAGHG